MTMETARRRPSMSRPTRIEPPAAISRTETVPRRRSTATDPTASWVGAPSRDKLRARTASPPIPPGKNVPTKVLTKKILTIWCRGTQGGVSTARRSAIHRQAISARSITTSPRHTPNHDNEPAFTAPAISVHEAFLVASHIRPLARSTRNANCAALEIIAADSTWALK